MTIDPNPNPTPAPAPPAGRDAQPNPQGGAPAADFDAAIGREAAGHAAHAATLAPSEIKKEADRIFNDRNSEFWKGGPNHDAQVALVHRSRELAAEAEGEPSEALSTTMRLANRALSLGDLPVPRDVTMHPKFAEVVENDVELKNFVTWADTENISTPLVREILGEYANAVAGGQITEQAMNQMQHKFEGRLRPDQISLLRRFVNEELNPALARNRQRRGR